MRIEWYLVCWSVVLGVVHIVLASHSASLQRGYRWTASARDADKSVINNLDRLKNAGLPSGDLSDFLIDEPLE